MKRTTLHRQTAWAALALALGFSFMADSVSRLAELTWRPGQTPVPCPRYQPQDPSGALPAESSKKVPQLQAFSQALTTPDPVRFAPPNPIFSADPPDRTPEYWRSVEGGFPASSAGCDRLPGKRAPPA